MKASKLIQLKCPQTSPTDFRVYPERTFIYMIQDPNIKPKTPYTCSITYKEHKVDLNFNACHVKFQLHRIEAK